MAKPSSLGITWEDVQKELERLPDAQAKSRSIDKLTEEQKKILCGMMRSGKKMYDIMAMWNGWGFPGSSATTLRKMFRDLEAAGY